MNFIIFLLPTGCLVNIQKELKDLINIQLKDNVKSRIIDAEQENEYIKAEEGEKLRSQIELYKYYQQKLKE